MALFSWLIILILFKKVRYNPYLFFEQEVRDDTENRQTV